MNAECIECFQEFGLAVHDWVLRLNVQIVPSENELPTLSPKSMLPSRN
ncbi:MAG: hypothetical protein AAGI88_08510 [Pseudomonadota bacterium]